MLNRYHYLLEIETNEGNARLEITQRGSFIDKDGNKVPSMYVIPKDNDIDLTPSDYKECYLTCINPNSPGGQGNYKFYRLIPNNANGNIDAEYGRIGANPGELFAPKKIQEPYDSYLYWVRYYEKLSKGYVDQSDVYLNDKKKKAITVKDTANQASKELYQLLLQYAKHVVNNTLANPNIINQTMIDKSKQIWRKLNNYKTVKGFNRQILKLMTISPRRAQQVDAFLADTTDDFPSIIDREEGLINAMEAVVNSNNLTVTTNSFDDFNIEVYEGTQEQYNQVKQHLPTSLQNQVKKVYRVIPKGQKSRFDFYVKNNNISKIKYLYHGSKKENWFSIVKNSLSLNPNASITGKALGYGLYFANDPNKSYNYCDSYNGESIMGLYATAYGNALHTTNYRHYTQDELDQDGYNCVHSHRGTTYWADEICFYKEEAVMLHYLIVFN